MSEKVITFGCRLNSYESELIREHVRAIGDEELIIFNSCAVTTEAERQLRQAIRKAHRENADSKIVVTGCAAHIFPENYANMEEVFAVIDNDKKLQLSSYKAVSEGDRGGIEGGKRDIYSLPQIVHEEAQVNNSVSIQETAGHLINGLEGKARAFIQVQNGCDHRCTFCIIPYGRGESRSVPIGEIVAQVQHLVDQGSKEIVLSGVDISDYGKGLPGNPSLGQMMKRLLVMVPELPRLRLSSIDVAEIDDELLDLIANEPRFMPHLHISLQAGDDMVLKRMKRRHLRQEVIDFCNQARELRPDMVFGADMIAGFPTESEEMFANSLALVEEAGLTYLHVFPYSEREGTPATKMPQVPKHIRKERAAKLREKGRQQVEKLHERKLGQTNTVLVENNNTGHTEDFIKVTLSTTHAPGTLVSCKLIGYDGAEKMVGNVQRNDDETY